MPKKILTDEFKCECAELVMVHGYQHEDTAEAINVGLSSIQRWVNQYRKRLCLH